MKRTVFKILKVVGIIGILGFIGLVIAFYQFSKPKSTARIVSDFEKLGLVPEVRELPFRGFKVREILMKSTGNSAEVPTLVFVHGTPGSALDFKKYMTDSVLLSKANMIAYDRVGFGVSNAGETQNSIAFDVSLLKEVTKSLDSKNTILVGYSYGGPIALASQEEYKDIVLLAPAVCATVEPMPAILNIYKWKATRWMVPKIWESAAIEKMSHKKELLKYDSVWLDQKSPITVIQGTTDRIVPYGNTLYLEKKFPQNQLSVVTLKDVGHGLVWSRFAEIKKELLLRIEK